MNQIVKQLNENTLMNKKNSIRVQTQSTIRMNTDTKKEEQPIIMDK